MIERALLGALVGLADFFILGMLRQRMARQAPSKRLGASFALQVARFSQLILFPVVGWFAGPLIMGG